MRKRSLYYIAVILLTSHAYADDSSFTMQQVVRNNNDYRPVNDNAIRSSNVIEWEAFCSGDLNILDKEGCTPDCTNTVIEATCSKLFKTSQIEKLSNVALPYDPHGVFIFRVNQNAVQSSANFALLVGEVPAKGNGYVCEILYKDGTPAKLINTTFASTESTISLDYHCTSGGSLSSCKSNNYVNFMSQTNTSAPHYAWYKNEAEPLYLLCLSYVEVSASPATLQSTTGCSGISGSCVYYLLQ